MIGYSNWGCENQDEQGSRGAGRFRRGDSILESSEPGDWRIVCGHMIGVWIRMSLGENGFSACEAGKVEVVRYVSDIS